MMEEAHSNEVKVPEEKREDNSLLFVYSLARQEEAHDAVGTILVAPNASVGLWVNGWIVCDIPFPITWKVYLEYRIGMVQYPGSLERVRRIVEKAIEIRLQCAGGLPLVAFYVSGNPNRSPSTYEVIVTFSFDTVDFLPQMQMAISSNAWSAQQMADEERQRLHRERSERGWLFNWLHRLFRLDYELDANAYQADILSGAPTEAFPSLYMPVFLAGMEVPCVLHLNEPRGKNAFSATLYSSDTFGKVQTPIDVISIGRWREGDKLHIFEKVIGSIITIT